MLVIIFYVRIWLNRLFREVLPPASRHIHLPRGASPSWCQGSLPPRGFRHFRLIPLRMITNPTALFVFVKHLLEMLKLCGD